MRTRGEQLPTLGDKITRWRAMRVDRCDLIDITWSSLQRLQSLDVAFHSIANIGEDRTHSQWANLILFAFLFLFLCKFSRPPWSMHVSSIRCDWPKAFHNQRNTILFTHSHSCGWWHLQLRTWQVQLFRSKWQHLDASDKRNENWSRLWSYVHVANGTRHLRPVVIDTATDIVLGHSVICADQQRCHRHQSRSALLFEILLSLYGLEGCLLRGGC